MSDAPVAVFHHPGQLAFAPRYEWENGQRIDHPETPARVQSILAALGEISGAFDVRSPQAYPLDVITQTHHPDLLALYRTAQALPDSQCHYPGFFPRDGMKAPNPTSLHAAGFYCIDTGTPLDNTTLEAALWSAACAVKAACHVQSGAGAMAYALCRPPGHHAGYRYFGGYCYFNNAALAATVLRQHGRVAVLDIDYHHGNGTQDIFYRDNQVLFVSLHADPAVQYPYVCGFADEQGEGAGQGYNRNIPLPLGTDGERFIRTLETQALQLIRQFGPQWLVVSAGFDTWQGDPLGQFTLQTEDYGKIGHLLAALGCPVVVVQEGGYDVPHLGIHTRTLLLALREGMNRRR